MHQSLTDKGSSTGRPYRGRTFQGVRLANAKVGMNIGCSRHRKVTQVSAVWWHERERGRMGAGEGSCEVGYGAWNSVRVDKLPFTQGAWIFLRPHSGHSSWRPSPHPGANTSPPFLLNFHHSCQPQGKQVRGRAGRTGLGGRLLLPSAQEREAGERTRRGRLGRGPLLLPEQASPSAYS